MKGHEDMEKISSTSYLRENVKNLTEGMTLKQIKEELGVHPNTQERVLTGDISVLSLTVIQRYAANSGIGISELFIEPKFREKYAEWYRETKLEYFPQNFEDYMHECGFTPKGIEKKMGKNKNMIRGYMNGVYYPRLGDIDHIADVLGVEVADLFLP